MKYKIYGSRIKLIDSYLVSKSNFQKELDKIRNLHPTCRIWKRSDGNIKREIAAHNLAYSLNIRRDKTESVDLEYEQRWWMSALYFVAGSIAWLFIK